MSPIDVYPNRSLGQDNPPAARVFHNANQATASGTPLALVFNSERYDTANLHDTVTNNGRLTAPTAGVYSIWGGVTIASNATNRRHFYITNQAGADIGRVVVPGLSGDVTRLQVASIYKLAVGEYVRLNVFQDSGSALDVVVEANRSPEFAMTWVALG